jgi:hypothetical protein
MSPVLGSFSRIGRFPTRNGELARWFDVGSSVRDTSGVSRCGVAFPVDYLICNAAILAWCSEPPGTSD